MAIMAWVILFLAILLTPILLIRFRLICASVAHKASISRARGSPGPGLHRIESQRRASQVT